MIAVQPQKSTWVILGTHTRAAYFGRLVKIEEGRVYLADAMKLPWSFDFEAMLDMANDGPPMQRAITWPVRSGSVAIFRPEEMIECSPNAAHAWSTKDWPRYVQRLSIPASAGDEDMLPDSSD